MEFTYEEWKELLKKLELSNKDIAEIIGTSTQNVANQISPSKKLPTWARAMIYMDKKNIEEPFTISGGCDYNLISIIPKDIANDLLEVKDTPEGQVMTLKQPDTKAPCGCSMTGRIFRRGDKCKLPREAHNF